MSSSCNHVLDEISVSWGVNDCNFVLRSLKLPQRDVDSDTSLSRCLDSIHKPSILESSHIGFVGLFLEFLEHPLLEATTQVNEMAGGG